MTETTIPEQEIQQESAVEPPISVRQILSENWILVRCLIMFILIMTVPLLVAWKMNLFLVAN